MRTTYVAYGFQLLSSFALPGMTPRADATLPSMHLTLVSKAELEATWSGSIGGVEWRGMLGDGCPLTIERGLEGDLLFAYADRAQFRLDAAKATIDCAPSEDGMRWLQVLLGRVLPNVAFERGCEGLHASAVESPEGVIAIAAPSGAGKTTLATELMRRGWPLFADDVLLVRAEEDGLRAHAGPPHMNVATSREDDATLELFGTTLAVFPDERWMAATRATIGQRPVRMVCLFERAPNLRLDLQRMPTSPLPLAPYMLGLPGDSERERTRFSLYSDLVQSAELVRITCGADGGPADLADLLEGALRSSALLTAVGSS